jgi:hypothetical protein
MLKLYKSCFVFALCILVFGISIYSGKINATSWTLVNQFCCSNIGGYMTWADAPNPCTVGEVIEVFQGGGECGDTGVCNSWKCTW